MYVSHFDAVLGYALRRTDRAEDAADVTAETFLVAWRRLAHVPTGTETRPWLYGVARRVLANHRRGDHRRTRARRPAAQGARDLGARHQRRRRAARRRRRGDAPAQRPRPGGARAAPLGGPRAARDRRGARPHHGGRPAPALPRPGPAARPARQRSGAARTSPLQTTPARPGRSGHEPQAHRRRRRRTAAPPRAGRAPGGDHEHSRPRRPTGPRPSAPPPYDVGSCRSAAAAVVAALAAGTAWWASGLGLVGSRGDRSGGSRRSRPGSRRHVLLDAPGWTVDIVVGDDDSRRDDLREGRPVPRRHVVPRRRATRATSRTAATSSRPPVDGEPIKVLGGRADVGLQTPTTTRRSARSRTATGRAPGRGDERSGVPRPACPGPPGRADPLLNAGRSATPGDHVGHRVRGRHQQLGVGHCSECVVDGRERQPQRHEDRDREDRGVVEPCGAEASRRRRRSCRSGRQRPGAPRTPAPARARTSPASAPVRTPAARSGSASAASLLPHASEQ